MRYVIVEQTFETDLNPEETVKYPAGWRGQMSPKLAKALEASGCGRIDADREAEAAAERKAEAARQAKAEAGAKAEAE